MIKSFKQRIEQNKALEQSLDSKKYELYLKDNDDVTREIRELAQQYFQYKEKFILPKKLRGIKNYIMYKGDRAVFLERSKKDRWKSNIKSPMTKILTDLVYSKIFNLDFVIYSRSIKDPNARETDEQVIGAVTDKEDTPQADLAHISVDENQAFADFCFSSSECRHGLSQQIWDLCSVWEWFAYVDMQTHDVYFDYNKSIAEEMLKMEWTLTDDDRARIKKQMWEKPFALNKSNAVYKYIPFSNVVYEFDKDFYDSSFVGVYIYDDLDVYLASHTFIKMTPASRNFVIKKKSVFSGKDYNKVKLFSSYNDYVLSSCKGKPVTNQDSLDKIIGDVEAGLMTGVNEVNKKKGEIYEHRTDETLTIFFNWNLIYDGPNPILPWIIPIIRMSKSDVWGATTSEGTTETLIDIQTSFDLISNSTDDALKATLSPIFYTKGYANIEWVGDTMPIGEGYKILKGDLDSIQRLETIRFDYGALRMLDYYWQQGLMAVGLNNVSAYTEGSVQQTSNNFNRLYSLSLDVLKPAIFSIWFGLTKAFKVWTILAEKKLPPSIKVKVQWDDTTAKDVVIRLSNLLSDSEIVYEPMSINDQQYQNIVNNFTLFSNFLQANKMNPITNVINYDNASLIKQFGKAVWLKWFLITDEQYYEQKRNAIEQEYELEKLKIEKQKELAALQPQPTVITWQNDGGAANGGWGSAPTTPVKEGSAPDFFENVFKPPVDMARE